MFKHELNNGTFSIKMYDKGDDSDFDIVYFLFFDGDIPRSASSVSLRFNFYFRVL